MSGKIRCPRCGHHHGHHHQDDDADHWHYCTAVTETPTGGAQKCACTTPHQ